MYSPTRRVSEVPELVGSICGFVEKSSWVNLLTVSRPFFHRVAPLIWKEIPGIAELLALLPYLDEELESEQPLVASLAVSRRVFGLLAQLHLTSYKQHIQPCNQDQLTRFSIYAPYVERLKSHAKTDRLNRNWDLLLTRVPTRPLLPNLRALGICPYYSQHSSRFIDYIDAFLCPTLSDVNMSLGYRLWMNPLETRELLVRMVATCPNMTSLNILPGSSHYPEDLSSLVPYSPSSVFTPISQFRDLRVLRTSSAVLNPDVLQLLGDLPCLESLWAYSLSTNDKKDDEIPIESLELPEHAFPSFRNLQLDCVPREVVSKLWQTPALVQNLVSVRIQFTYDTESPSDLICAVCEGSPNITDLELEVGKSEDIELLDEVIEQLSKLSLLRVRIWEGQVNVRALIFALPNVEYLNIESTCADCEDLALIAKHMPKLQYLKAELLIWSWPAERALPSIPQDSSSPVPCYIESKLTFGNSLDTDHPEFDEFIDNVARYGGYLQCNNSFHSFSFLDTSILYGRWAYVVIYTIPKKHLKGMNITTLQNVLMRRPTR